MLDLTVQQILAGAAGAPDLCDLPPAASRGLYSQILAATSPALADVDIHSRAIPGPDGDLAIRIYQPRNPASTPRGVVLYLHGGGFVLGNCLDYEGVCSQLCSLSDCVLVQVDYRLAPEHPFPAAVDDCYATLQWLAEHAAELGADPTRLAVCGDSAGANLAAVLCLLARDRQGPSIALQALIYPVTDRLPELYASYNEFGRGFTLSTRAAWSFTELYRGSRDPDGDWRAAPLLAASHANLPPALMLVAGMDILRDEGRAYADKLQAAGVHVSLIEYANLPHGFISMSGAVHSARLALFQLADGLALALNG